MKNKQLFAECVNLTQTFINNYFSRKLDLCLPYIDNQFVMFGPYDFQYTHGKTEFTRTINKRIKEETDKVKINVTHDQYALIYHNAYTWIIESCFYTDATTVDDRYLLAKNRCTFVWKRKKDSWVLLHLHASYARDLPLVFDSTFDHNVLKNYSTWLESIKTLDQKENKMNRLSFTDINGNIHYLFPSEIIYIKVDDKLCSIHTFGNQLTVRSSLTAIYNENPFLIQVHKQYLVNKQYVKSIKRYQLTLTNDQIIPVSQKYYMTIKNVLKS